MDTQHDLVAIKDLDTRYAELRLVRPELVGALRHSIERHGLLHPLVVNESNEALVLLDGFKRLHVVRERSGSQVAVRRVHLEETQAKAAIVTFNRPHRGLSDLEEAWVVSSLVRGNKMRQIDVAALLGKHKSWVSRRLQLVERLDENVIDDMRLGLVSVTLARELARLPRGNQAALAKVSGDEGLTTRQATELISLWLDAEGTEGQDALLDDPMQFLTPPAQPEPRQSKRDPRLSPGADKVRQSLLRFEHAAQRLEHSVRWQQNAGLRPTDTAALASSAGVALEAAARATRLVSALCDLENGADHV